MQLLYWTDPGLHGQVSPTKARQQQERQLVPRKTSRQSCHWQFHKRHSVPTKAASTYNNRAADEWLFCGCGVVSADGNWYRVARALGRPLLMGFLSENYVGLNKTFKKLCHSWRRAPSRILWQREVKKIQWRENRNHLCFYNAITASMYTIASL